MSFHYFFCLSNVPRSTGRILIAATPLQGWMELLYMFMFGNHVVMFGEHGFVYEMHLIHVCSQKYIDVCLFYLSIVSI